jgi:hypothetical protein
MLLADLGGRKMDITLAADGFDAVIGMSRWKAL